MTRARLGPQGMSALASSPASSGVERLLGGAPLPLHLGALRAQAGARFHDRDVLVAQDRAWKPVGEIRDAGGGVGLVVSARGYRFEDTLGEPGGPVEPLALSSVQRIVECASAEWWSGVQAHTLEVICDRPCALVEDVSEDPEWLRVPPSTADAP